VRGTGSAPPKARPARPASQVSRGYNHQVRHALHCTVQRILPSGPSCTALHCIALHCTALYCSVQRILPSGPSCPPSPQTGTCGRVQGGGGGCHAMPCHAMPCHAMPCHSGWPPGALLGQLGLQLQQNLHHLRPQLLRLGPLRPQDLRQQVKEMDPSPSPSPRGRPLRLFRGAGPFSFSEGLAPFPSPRRTWGSSCCIAPPPGGRGHARQE
jgi:hypothetical protein